MKTNGHGLENNQVEPSGDRQRRYVVRRRLPGLTGENQLLGAVVEWAKADLQRPGWCLRHEMALAWIVGFFSCGCPNEQTGLTLMDVANHLSVGIDELRRLLLTGVPRRSRARYLRCRDANQIELRFQDGDAV